MQSNSSPSTDSGWDALVETVTQDPHGPVYKDGKPVIFDLLEDQMVRKAYNALYAARKSNSLFIEVLDICNDAPMVKHYCEEDQKDDTKLCNNKKLAKEVRDASAFLIKWIRREKNIFTKELREKFKGLSTIDQYQFCRVAYDWQKALGKKLPETITDEDILTSLEIIVSYADYYQKKKNKREGDEGIHYLFRELDRLLSPRSDRTTSTRIYKAIGLLAEVVFPEGGKWSPDRVRKRMERMRRYTPKNEE